MKSYKDLINKCVKTGGFLRNIGKTSLGYDIPLLSKGKGEARILLIGSVHAREHITTPLLLNLFGEYRGKHPIDCIPALNIDGVMLAKNGINSLPLRIKQRDYLINLNGSDNFSLWKANIRGVDINVNFDAGWGEGRENVEVPASESYIGAAPNSETETQAVVNLLKKTKYALVVAYHSKGEEIYFGFREDNRYQEYADKYANFLGYTLKETRHSAGGIKDYWTKSTGRLGLTVEVGKDSFSHPYPEKELPALIKQHSGSLELLAEIGKELWTKYDI
ncbi:MAG: M14 family zinc carboxypeptidase [Clostridia bacterium]